MWFLDECAASSAIADRQWSEPTQDEESFCLGRQLDEAGPAAEQLQERFEALAKKLGLKFQPES